MFFDGGKVGVYFLGGHSGAVYICRGPAVVGKIMACDTGKPIGDLCWLADNILMVRCEKSMTENCIFWCRSESALKTQEIGQIVF